MRSTEGQPGCRRMASHARRRNRICCLLKAINALVEIARHVQDVAIAPRQRSCILPTSNLKLECRPVIGRTFVAPMHLCRVAGDAMRRVQQLAARLRHRRRSEDGDGDQQPSSTIIHLTLASIRCVILKWQSHHFRLFHHACRCAVERRYLKVSGAPFATRFSRALHAFRLDRLHQILRPRHGHCGGNARSCPVSRYRPPRDVRPACWRACARGNRSRCTA